MIGPGLAKPASGLKACQANSLYGTDTPAFAPKTDFLIFCCAWTVAVTTTSSARMAKVFFISLQVRTGRKETPGTADSHKNHANRSVFPVLIVCPGKTAYKNSFGVDCNLIDVNALSDACEIKSECVHSRFSLQVCKGGCLISGHIKKPYNAPSS